MSDITNSKNIVTARIDANGNVIVGDGNNITVINLKEAAQYKHLEAEIEKLNTRFERTQQRIEKYPDDQELTIELLEIDEERSQKIKDQETLRQEVLKLAEDFARIPINTERLKKAKAYFENGEFAEARAVLDAEVMGQELDALLEQKETLSIKIQENQQSLSDKAIEYLILARLTATDFELSDRFEKTVEYFEQSLRAERNVENILAFATFLKEHNRYIHSKKLFEEALIYIQDLEKNSPQKNQPVMALTLNNLAALYSAENELDLAQVKYEQALKIREELAKINSEIFNQEVANTLNDLAILHHRQKKFDEAEDKFKKCLAIYNSLEKVIPELSIPNTVKALNNLANLYKSKDELKKAQTLYRKALEISRNLAENNPEVFLPLIALTLNNLASMQLDENRLKNKAKGDYEEALKIYRSLSLTNPAKFLPYVVKTSANMASFYQVVLPNKKRSLELAYDFFKLGSPFFDDLPDLKNYKKWVLKVIKDWGADENEFLK